MKKKVVSALLCAAMVATMATGCGSNSNTSGDADKATEKEASDDAEKTEDAATDDTADADADADADAATDDAAETVTYTMADPEEITTEAKYHYTFDEAEEGVHTAVRTDDPGTNDGATYGIEESDTYKDDEGNDQPATVQYVAGPVGNAAYLDGNFGLKMDVEGLDTETYSISFWVNADRLSTYGPTMQIGSNMGMSDTTSTVKWINFTQTEWGTDSAKIFPVVWDRNSETGAWPWVYATDDAIHGKQEWVMVTLVGTGNVYNYADDGLDRNGCKMYLDGVLAFDASADAYGGLATGIMDSADTFECLFGINYWDTIFKGYVDDMYIFDYALTDGQVATLYQLGDVSAAATVDDAAATDDAAADDTAATPADLPEITADASAIATLGATTRDNDFWTSFSDGYELADGSSKTFTFHNYSSAADNWDNYLFAFCNTATTADKAPSADNYADYAEYGVLRSDAYAWGFAADPTYTFSWAEDFSNFASIMTDADVKATISRSGSDVNVDAVITAADGTEYTYTAACTTTAAAADPMYVFMTNEKSYVELLSVE